MINKTAQQTKRTYWQGHVQTQKESGLTQAQYCRDHGLKLGTFNWWYCQGSKTAPAPKVAPLTVVPMQIASSPQASPAGTITVQHRSGWELRLPGDVVPSWLGNLLKALA